MTPGPRSVLREGIVAGLIGAAVVAVWFLCFDVARGQRALRGGCREWCADGFGDGYYGGSPARTPRGPAAGARRVSRGGAWRHADPWSPVAHRSSLAPQLR